MAMARLIRHVATLLAAGLSFVASAEPAFSDIVKDCKSGDPVRAIEACSVVIEEGRSAPMDLATAYTYRANAAEASGGHMPALADLTKAIELNPSSAIAYNNRGNIYFYLGDFDHALEDYNKAIHLDLESAGAYFNRGNLYSRQGDLDRAMTDLTAAVHINPTYAPAYFNRGIVYLRMGRISEAVADFRRTLEFKPQHSGALRALRFLESAN